MDRFSVVIGEVDAFDFNIALFASEKSATAYALNMLRLVKPRTEVQVLEEYPSRIEKNGVKCEVILRVVSI